jgi:hypothetical protein
MPWLEALRPAVLRLAVPRPGVAPLEMPWLEALRPVVPRRDTEWLVAPSVGLPGLAALPLVMPQVEAPRFVEVLQSVNPVTLWSATA